MNNEELIQEIYDICMTADWRKSPALETIIGRIEKERPDLVTFTAEEIATKPPTFGAKLEGNDTPAPSTD
jgi:hypothetical protein